MPPLIPAAGDHATGETPIRSSGFALEQVNHETLPLLLYPSSPFLLQKSPWKYSFWVLSYLHAVRYARVRAFTCMPLSSEYQ
jgi:hypothetical protein